MVNAYRTRNEQPNVLDMCDGLPDLVKFTETGGDLEALQFIFSRPP